MPPKNAKNAGSRKKKYHSSSRGSNKAKAEPESPTKSSPKPYVKPSKIDYSSTQSSNLTSILDKYTLPDTYYGDPELEIVCKRLLKKDYTTKLKAFDELSNILDERGGAVIGGFVGFFVYVYINLSLDNSR